MDSIMTSFGWYQIQAESSAITNIFKNFNCFNLFQTLNEPKI